MIDARSPGGRGKVGGPRGGVNFLGPLVLGTVGAAVLGAAVLAGGCARPLRPLPVALAEPADWPTVLGGVRRAGFAAEPVPEDPEVAWRAEVGRGLLSAPLVDGTAVFAATANRLVVAVAARDGEHYWERRLGGPIGGGLVRRGGTLFVATEGRDGELQALEVERGARRWARRVGSVMHAPLLVGEAVYVATERGAVVALDARTGEELWTARLGGRAASTPVPYRESLLVATSTDTLFLLDRTDGSVQGRAALPARVSAAPALVADTVYLPLHSGELLALELPGLAPLWRAGLGAPILAAPAAAPDGTLYVLTRSAEVWRVPAGARAPERLASLEGAARASLTLVRDGLLVGRLDGTLFFLRTDGTVAWRKGLGDSIVAPAAVHDGAIYVPLLRGTIVKLGGTP